MAAVAVHADLHRKELADALAPLRTAYPPDTIWAWQRDTFPSALRCLFDAVPREDLRFAKVIRPVDLPLRQPTTATVLRINELVDALLAGRTVPSLLATPTEASGAIDPGVLLDRLDAYARRGAQPLQHDLQQALIRVAPDSDYADRIRAACGGLGLLPAAVPTLDDFYDQAKNYGTNLMPYARPLGMPSTTRPEPLHPVGDEVASPFWILVPPHDPDDKMVFGRASGQHQPGAWPVLLPHQPELLASHAVPRLYSQANGEDSSAYTIFPDLAETAGIPGPITHLALAYGLAADQLTHRVAARDALLTLAARGLLQPEQLGRCAAELWRREMIRTKRLLTSLQEAAQAGAATHVFATAATAVGILSTTPEIRGLPDLLLLATRWAPGDASARSTEIPGLTSLTTVSRPSRVGQEARRLTEALKS